MQTRGNQRGGLGGGGATPPPLLLRCTATPIAAWAPAAAGVRPRPPAAPRLRPPIPPSAAPALRRPVGRGGGLRSGRFVERQLRDEREDVVHGLVVLGAGLEVLQFRVLRLLLAPLHRGGAGHLRCVSRAVAGRATAMRRGRGGGRGMHWKGGRLPPPPSRLCPATAPRRQVPASMAIITDSNRPQPLRQRPPTACLTASRVTSEVPSLLMHPWGVGFNWSVG